MVAAIASTIVYVVGTVLYGVLTALVLRRRDKTWSEIILLLLGMSAAVWYFGNALDRFAHYYPSGQDGNLQVTYMSHFYEMTKPEARRHLAFLKRIRGIGEEESQ